MKVEKIIVAVDEIERKFLFPDHFQDLRLRFKSV